MKWITLEELRGIVKDDSRGEDDYSMSAALHPTKADIRYQYHLAGVELEGTRVTLHFEYRREKVDELVAMFPVGARTTALRNPADPHDVVLAPQLSRGVHRDTWPIGLITLVMGLLAIAAQFGAFAAFSH